MTRSNLRTGSKIVVLLAAGMLVPGGCDCHGHVVPGSSLMTPTVDNLPDQTYESELQIGGQRDPLSAVWVQLEKSTDAQMLMDASDSSAWTGTLPLDLGTNNFVVFATEGLSFSLRAGPFTVVRLPRVVTVGAPTLDPVTTPTNRTPQRLSGTKPADTSLWLVKDSAPSNEIQIIAQGADTTWSHDLALVEGTNGFSVYCRQTGIIDHSAAVSASIVLDTVPPTAPEVNQPTSPTGLTVTDVSGTKAADGNLCLRRDQDPTCTEVAANDGQTDFLEVVDLNNGYNYLCFSSVDLVGNASDETCVVVVKIAGPTVTVTKPHPDGVIKASTEVVAQVDGGASPEEAVSSVRICIDATCQTVIGVGDQYTATFDVSSFQDGSTHQVSVTATNAGGAVTTVSFNVTYSNGTVLVLSNETVPSNTEGVRLVYDPVHALVHAVWADECIFWGIGLCPQSKAGNNPWDIFYRVLNGDTWGPILLISDDAADGDSRAPTIAVDGAGVVHIAWQESGNVQGKGSNAKIVYRTLTTGTLGAITVVSNTTKDSLSPSIAVSTDNAVHLVWEQQQASNDHDIMYSRKPAAGSFSAAAALSQDTCTGASPQATCETLAGCRWTTSCVAVNGDSRTPRVVCDHSSIAHVVWQEKRPVTGATHDIYYRAVAGGVPQAITRLVSDNVFDGESFLPVLAIDSSDTLHIAWRDTATVGGVSAIPRIWYRSFASGAFSPSNSYIMISATSSLGSDTPAIAVAPDDSVVIAWAEVVAGPSADISFCSGQNLIFDSPQTAYADAGLSVSPAVAVDAGSVAHLVWHDDTPIPPADPPRPGSLGGGPDTDVLYVNASLQ